MKIIFSGAQPTGTIHLGNYFGAIKNWVDIQNNPDFNDFEKIYCIVDLHALTIEQDPKKFPDQVLDLALDYLALGIDPKESTLFVQSQVPEHTELTWIFNTITPVSELERMTQYKEKSAQHEKNINMGLLDYPVLMAADILLYKASVVPVGEDQLQHVELARIIARKFNNKYGEIFPEPKGILPDKNEVARLGGLDGTGKMSKSKGNFVGVFEDPETIKGKFKKAKTDSGSEIKKDCGQEIKNLITIYCALTGKAENEAFPEIEGKGYGDFKKILADTAIGYFAEFRKKRAELAKDLGGVKKILDNGAAKAKEMAAETMTEVREKVGLKI